MIINLSGYEVLEDGFGERDNRMALFVKESDAKSLVQQSKHYRNYRKYDETIEIFDSLVDYFDSQKKKIQLQALQKLSPDERVALGFPENMKDVVARGARHAF